jgi:transcriptional regulator with XRE-family HTH domain
MLNENMKVIRKSKGLSQEERTMKLNIIRQNGIQVRTWFISFRF